MTPSTRASCLLRGAAHQLAAARRIAFHTSERLSLIPFQENLMSDDTAQGEPFSPREAVPDGVEVVPLAIVPPPAAEDDEPEGLTVDRFIDLVHRFVEAEDIPADQLVPSAAGVAATWLHLVRQLKNLTPVQAYTADLLTVAIYRNTQNLVLVDLDATELLGNGAMEFLQQHMDAMAPQLAQRAAELLNHPNPAWSDAQLDRLKARAATAPTTKSPDFKVSGSGGFTPPPTGREATVRRVDPIGDVAEAPRSCVLHCLLAEGGAVVVTTSKEDPYAPWPEESWPPRVGDVVALAADTTLTTVRFLSRPV